MSQQLDSSSSPHPAFKIARSILAEAAQRPWLAALLMRRPCGWLTQLAQWAQWARDLPRHTRRALRRKLASGLAAAALLLALAGTPTTYAGTITVDGATCTLAQAITTANDGSVQGSCTLGDPAGADTLNLTVDVSLTAALPNITSDITIEGGGHTISGNNAYRVIEVSSGAALTLTQATIRDGNAIGSSGGGIRNYGTLTVQASTISGNTANHGGGIANSGALTVTNSTLSNNTSLYGRGGGIFNDYGTLTVQTSTLSGNTSTSYGGGLYNGANGALAVTNSTLSGNRASNHAEGWANGGGIFNSGSLTVANSTLSGNTADATAGAANGGGIYNYSGGSASVQNSTIANNDAYGSNMSEGGGIAGAATISNSLVVSNTLGLVVGNDCNSFLTSGDYNMESGASCGLTGAHDQQNVDPVVDLKLQPLANNGAQPHPFTHALGAGSVAIDKIPNGANGCVAGASTDERGAVRAGDNVPPGSGTGRGGAACDIGAYEVSGQTPTAVTLLDLTANSSPGALGAALAAFAALVVLLVRRRVKGKTLA